jgi:butyryl-CoA dehydrogenase
VLGGWQMGRAALVANARLGAGEGDAAFYQAKIITARFFAEHILSQADALRFSITDGASSILSLPETQF